MNSNETKTEHDLAARRFEARLLAHLDALYNRALEISGSREEAEELVVETSVRAWRGFNNDGPSRPGKGWLFSILHAIATNERNSGGRQPEVEAAKELSLSEADGFAATLASSSPGLPRYANPDQALNSTDVAQVVDRLPETLRMPLILVDRDQLTYEDAARVIRCPVNTLRTRLFRARRALFVLLKESAPLLGMTKDAGIS